MKRLLDDGLLPSEYYIVGDEAYVNTQQLLTPWSGRGIGVWKDSFNFHLSGMRQCIERAFGQMTKRWGILWRPLSFAFALWPDVITLCAKLHNYCIDEGGQTMEVPIHQHEENRQEGDVCELILNENHLEPDAPNLRGLTRGDRRKAITTNLQVRGIVRPAHARMNSRA
jgi:hypothetical protein